jgi:hypothetical protein
MNRVALIGALLVAGSGAAWCQDRPEEPQPIACVPRQETRALFFEKKLVPPFKVMHEAAILGQAEAIDIQLCRFQTALVYDVTLLTRDGRVVHRLFAAATGGPLGGGLPGSLDRP